MSHDCHMTLVQWSCCYKKDGNAIGCRAATHVDAATGQS